MRDLATSRRGMLAVMAAAPLLTAPAFAMATPAHGEALWNALQKDRANADLAYQTFNKRRWEPVSNDLKRRAPRPDMRFSVTAKNGQTAEYRLWHSDLHAYDAHPKAFAEPAACIREALAKHEKVSAELGMDALDQEADHLSSLVCDLESRLITTPAPHAAALMWKLDHLFGGSNRDEGGFSPAWCLEWMDVVMADARRFLGGQA